MDFGLLPPGDWWLDTTYTTPISSSGSGLATARQLRLASATATQRKQSGNNRTNPHQPQNRTTLEQQAQHESAAAARSFFSNKVGQLRVRNFVAWLASRPERNVSIVVDSQVSVSFLFNPLFLVGWGASAVVFSDLGGQVQYMLLVSVT